MDITTCAFMGLGLIGGSIAKAVKKAKPHIQIKAFDINRQTLHLAMEEGIIDEAYPSLKPDFFGAIFYSSVHRYQKMMKI